MKKLLHAGSGPIRLSAPGVEWVNVDIELNHPVDYCLDYTRDLITTFGPDFFDSYYSCHSLEHCALPNGIIAALAQAHAVLKPGGVIRIVVPDLMKVAKKYVAGEDLRDIYDGPYHDGPDFPATRFMFFCRAWSHTVLFDESLLTHFMSEAGFRVIKAMPFNVSRIPELCGLDRFQSESLIVEAIK